jgi:hypothetical protein
MTADLDSHALSLIDSTQAVPTVKQGGLTQRGSIAEDVSVFLGTCTKKPFTTLRFVVPQQSCRTAVTAVTPPTGGDVSLIDCKCLELLQA